MTKKELEEGRHIGYRIYGYFYSYCEQTRSCEVCDPAMRFGCRIKRMIEDLQTKHILRICK